MLHLCYTLAMTHLPATFPPPLRGADIGSFAHDTVVRRMPATVRRVLHENDLLPAAADAVATLAAEIPHAPVRAPRDHSAPDLELWDTYTAPYQGQNWLEVPWFFAETAMYRRILEATGYFQPGAGFYADPYALQKRLALAECTLAALPDNLGAALAAALWGNQADLSLWPAGEQASPGATHILADDTPQALAYLDQLASHDARVDLILDNVGSELIHDLLLADLLLRHRLRLVIHAKPHPTFVSDALVVDVQNTVGWLSQHEHAAPAGQRLLAALADGRIELRDDWYWTSPLPGWEMPAHLHHDLSRSGLLIGKAMANYRRWFGDLHWPTDTPLQHVLSYAPAPILLLRTCKSEIVLGIPPERSQTVAQQDADWMTSGRWGVIQFWPGNNSSS